MSKQMDLIRTKDLGFDDEQVVVVDTGGFHGLPEVERMRLLDLYRQTATYHNDVLSVSMASRTAGKGSTWGTTIKYKGEWVNCRTFVVDYDFIETLGIPLVEGRDFSRNFKTDVDQAALINEIFAKTVDIDSLVGKPLPLKSTNPNHRFDATIIGILKDFHFESLHNKVEPAMFRLKTGNGPLQYIFIRIGPDNISATLTLLKEKWEQVVKDRPFAFTFLNEDVERQYRTEERWSNLLSLASAISISLACLGALGLTALAVTRRTKEIGIRKVLGASLSHIIFLLTRELIFLAMLANLVAWPITHFIMNRWLENFAYQAYVGVEIHAFGGMLAVAIVLTTVSYQSIRAAMSNPVDALRNE